jgi:cephalosporin hydroxylase
VQSELAPLESWDSEETWRTFEEDTFHHYLGEVELQKCEQDLNRYTDLIEISQPDVVIETGTRRGGSALWFQLQGLKVITIDSDWDAGADARRAHGDNIPNIEFIRGRSSIDARLGFEVQKHLQQGQRVMVSLDADHHTDHVMGEILLWSTFVSVGCYLVIEDGCFDMWPADRARVGGAEIPERGGPLGAIRRSHALLSAQGFWRDTYVENLHPVSHSPVGWWRHYD